MTKEKQNKIYLLLCNPKKSNNLGPVLRCSVAFGVEEIIAVGFSKCCVKGSHGASKYMQITDFPTTEQAIKYLQQECDCPHLNILGLLGGLPTNNADDIHDVYIDEISDHVHIYNDVNSSNNNRHDHHQQQKQLQQKQKQQKIVHYKMLQEGEGQEGLSNQNKISYPIHKNPFAAHQSNNNKNYCFVIGKSNKGLPVSLAKHCSRFIHIPHECIFLGPRQPSLLLDLPSYLSIVLGHFTDWAEYGKHSIRDMDKDNIYKYKKQSKSNDDDDKKRKRNNRIEQQMIRDKEAEVTMSSLGIFDNKNDDDGDY